VVSSTCGGVCACRSVPSWEVGGSAVLHSRTGHTVRTVAELALEAGAEVSVHGRTCTLAAAALDELLLHIADGLTATELAEARVALGPFDPGADLLELGMGAVPFAELAARLRHQDLAALLAEPARFYALFQPIVEVHSETTVAFEALLRARAEDGGQIGAADLFPPAAATGVTHTLDRIGRETAIRDAAADLADRELFINFVPTSIYRPELCLATTVAAAGRHGVALEQLVFEVTETEQVQDTAHLLDIVRYYREQGAQVALDDVGSGYASIELVQTLAPDVIKIDRSIVCRLPSAGSIAVVSALVAIGGELGARVLAEGVETEQEAAICRDLGVDLAQGWYFARPARELVPARHASFATA
jgi:EAL domain-containing protein (putative c-di-GMP-specific phosphodiesterase class I)